MRSAPHRSCDLDDAVLFGEHDRADRGCAFGSFSLHEARSGRAARRRSVRKHLRQALHQCSSARPVSARQAEPCQHLGRLGARCSAIRVAAMRQQLPQKPGLVAARSPRRRRWRARCRRRAPAARRDAPRASAAGPSASSGRSRSRHAFAGWRAARPNPSPASQRRRADRAPRCAAAAARPASPRAPRPARRRRRASSSRRKCGESAASSGKRRSSDWQKAWMVPIRMPPGRSSTRANSARAQPRVASSGSTCRAAQLGVERRGRPASPRRRACAAAAPPSRPRRPW